MVKHELIDTRRTSSTHSSETRLIHSTTEDLFVSRGLWIVHCNANINTAAAPAAAGGVSSDGGFARELHLYCIAFICLLSASCVCIIVRAFFFFCSLVYIMHACCRRCGVWMVDRDSLILMWTEKTQFFELNL